MLNYYNILNIINVTQDSTLNCFMRLLKNLEEVRIHLIKKPLFLTFGFFDGFHAGHRLVLSHLLSLTKKKSAYSLVITFENMISFTKSKNNQKTTLNKNTNSSLALCQNQVFREHIYSLETKIKILKQIGVDYCLLLNFSEIKNMRYTKFLNFFFQNCKIYGLVASDKLTLGYQKKGTTKQIVKYFSQSGSHAYILPSVNFSKKSKIREQVKISSTEIRKLLNEGKIYQANQKLKLPFHLVSYVKKGKSWGRKIGFPTINFNYPSESVKIPPASYITVSVIQRKIYPSMSYVGIPMGKKIPIVETYLLNFSKTVYNNKVMIYFIKNLEKDKQIDSLSDLEVLLSKLRIRLEKYLEKNTLFFQEKLNTIKKITNVVE